MDVISNVHILNETFLSLQVNFTLEWFSEDQDWFW